MTAQVTFVKPFADPNMISERQFKMIVGGKVADPTKPKGYQGYFGLVNSKIVDPNLRVTDNSPTLGELLAYSSAINDNGVPFRKWTNLFSLNKKQAQSLIKFMLDTLPDREENVASPVTTTVSPKVDDTWGATPVVATPVVAENHVKIPATLPDGRYHLEGSGGYYATVRTSEKNGKQYIHFSV